MDIPLELVKTWVKRTSKFVLLWLKSSTPSRPNWSLLKTNAEPSLINSARPLKVSRRRYDNWWLKLILISLQNADTNAAKEKLSFKSVAEIDRRVAEIEITLDSGRFTLSEEKQMLGEKSKLLKARKALEALDGSGSDVNSLRMRLDQIKLRQADVEASITAKRAEINAVHKQIDEINGVQAAEYAKRQDGRAELDRLRALLDAEFAKKKAAYEELTEAKAAREAAYFRGVARREEQERCQAIEAEIDELEKQLGKMTTENVIDKKWNECTSLINFFTAFLPKSASTTAPAAESKIRQPPAIDLSKVEVINKKSQDCYYVPNKQKGKNKQASAQVAETSAAADLNKLPFHILAALTDMALPLPQNVETDVPALLETLNQRRNDLQGHRDASMAEIEARRGELLGQIAGLRAKIESKDEQITAAMVKKRIRDAEAAEASAEPATESL